MEINMQEKTHAKEGCIRYYEFDNGYRNIVYHSIVIPLTEFDSEISWSSQPEKTAFEFDLYELCLKNPYELDELDLSFHNYEDIDASVYIGSRHNSCYPEEFKFKKICDKTYKVSCRVLVDFEDEGVAENETYQFETILKFY